MDVPAGALRPRDVRHILEQYQEQFGLSQNTVKKRHTALQMLFSWLRDEELVDKNPVRRNDAPRARVVHTPALPVEKFESLRSALIATRDGRDSNEKDSRAAQSILDLVDVLWRSGMRSAQAHRLRWVDIDLERMVWLVRSPGENKGRERLQPIHKDLKEILLRRRLYGDEGPFMPEGHHRYIFKKWKEANPQFKGNLSLHMMRSRVVTDLARMKEFQAKKDLVGHTTEATNEIYTDLSVEDHREALNRL